MLSSLRALHTSFSFSGMILSYSQWKHYMPFAPGTTPHPTYLHLCWSPEILWSLNPGTIFCLLPHSQCLRAGSKSSRNNLLSKSWDLNLPLYPTPEHLGKSNNKFDHFTLLMKVKVKMFGGASPRLCPVLAASPALSTYSRKLRVGENSFFSFCYLPKSLINFTFLKSIHNKNGLTNLIIALNTIS